MHIDKVTRRAVNIEPNMCWECYSCVKACPNVNMTREQFAMFMDCPPKENLKLPKYSLKYDDVVHTPFLPEGVPKLKSRLTNANVYEEFVVNTINAYYNTPHKGGGS